MAGTGIFGFLAFMGFMIASFVVCVRGVVSGGDNKGVFVGLLGALLCFHVSGLTQVNFLDGEVQHLFVFLSAMLWAISARRAKAFNS